MGPQVPQGPPVPGDEKVPPLQEQGPGDGVLVSPQPVQPALINDVPHDDVRVLGMRRAAVISHNAPLRPDGGTAHTAHRCTGLKENLSFLNTPQMPPRVTGRGLPLHTSGLPDWLICSRQ